MFPVQSRSVLAAEITPWFPPRGPPRPAQSQFSDSCIICRQWSVNSLDGSNKNWRRARYEIWLVYRFCRPQHTWVEAGCVTMNKLLVCIPAHCPTQHIELREACNWPAWFCFASRHNVEATGPQPDTKAGAGKHNSRVCCFTGVSIYSSSCWGGGGRFLALIYLYHLQTALAMHNPKTKRGNAQIFNQMWNKLKWYNEVANIC